MASSSSASSKLSTATVPWEQKWKSEGFSDTRHTSAVGKPSVKQLTEIHKASENNWPVFTVYSYGLQHTCKQAKIKSIFYTQTSAINFCPLLTCQSCSNASQEKTRQAKSESRFNCSHLNWCEKKKKKQIMHVGKTLQTGIWPRYVAEGQRKTTTTTKKMVCKIITCLSFKS